jgi:hypothetical protein
LEGSTGQAGEREAGQRAAVKPREVVGVHTGMLLAWCTGALTPELWPGAFLPPPIPTTAAPRTHLQPRPTAEPASPRRVRVQLSQPPRAWRARPAGLLPMRCWSRVETGRHSGQQVRPAGAARTRGGVWTRVRVLRANRVRVLRAERVRSQSHVCVWSAVPACASYSPAWCGWWPAWRCLQTSETSSPTPTRHLRPAHGTAWQRQHRCCCCCC